MWASLFKSVPVSPLKNIKSLERSMKETYFCSVLYSSGKTPTASHLTLSVQKMGCSFFFFLLLDSWTPKITPPHLTI